MVIADRYEVLRSLGTGGMGAVFLARDELLAREVAVKLLHGDGDEAMGRRLQREARLGASLNHPNLVTVYDTLIHEDRLVVVMEFVEGENLAQAIKAGPIAPERALGILGAVADALDHAHAAGVVHRDVKPANILLGPGETVKLADLGIAVGADSTRVTQTGAALGSVAYMAPEQFRSGDPTPATDVHALATVAFELLSGRKARPGSTPVEIVGRIDSEPPPDLRDAWPAAPPAAAAALERAMARDPAERPATAGALVADLREALTDDDDADVPPARSDRPPRRGPLVGALAALLLVGVVVAALAGGGEEPRRPAERGSTGAAASPAPEPSAEPSPAPAPAEAEAEAETGGGDPAAAVRALYERAASQDAEGVCARLGPTLKARFSCAEFTGQFSTLESVTFQQDEVVEQTDGSAAVQVRTTATHTTFTDRCEGRVELVPGGPEGWLVDDLAVTCR